MLENEGWGPGALPKTGQTAVGRHSLYSHWGPPLSSTPARERRLGKSGEVWTQGYPRTILHFLQSWIQWAQQLPPLSGADS